MDLACKGESIELHDMKICGEIGTLLSVGKKEFFLNCKFCDKTYLQLESFVNHVCEDHLCELTDQLSSELTQQLKEEMECVDIGPDPISFLDANQEELIDFKSLEKDELDTNATKEDIKMFYCSEKTCSEESMSSVNLTFKEEEGELEPTNCRFSDTNDVTGTSPTGECDQVDNHPEKYCKQKELTTNKKFTIELIQLYRTLPALWNINSDAFKNSRLQNEQLEILLTKYREKYTNATEKDVTKKMQYLCANYRHELKAAGLSGKSRLYYFDEMQFLKDLTQPSLSETDRRDSDMNELEDTQEKNATKGSFLNSDQAINLANILKRHTCLWDENDITFRFTNRRQEALDSILLELRETSGLTNLTKNILEIEIRKLRKLCSTEKKKKIECKQNNTPFKSTSPFYKHIAFLEVNVKPYECSICGDLIPAWTLYKKHLSSHDGSPPYKCQLCGQGFKRLNNYTVHLRVHAQDFTYSCEVCSKRCSTTTILKVHMRSHTGEKPYVCHYCGKLFKYKSAYLVHMQRHENKPRHKCDICSKLFFNKQSLKEHVSAHLQLRNYICNVCDKGFTCAKHLRQHKQIHSKVKKYICKICEKRFAQAAGLNSHMKSHGMKSSNISTESNDF